MLLLAKTRHSRMNIRGKDSSLLLDLFQASPQDLASLSGKKASLEVSSDIMIRKLPEAHTVHFLRRERLER